MITLAVFHSNLALNGASNNLGGEIMDRDSIQAEYYQVLHDTNTAFQNNNWLLEELDAINSLGSESLVELACGNGLFLAEAASHWKVVSGVDWARSPNITKVLDSHSNVRFFQADIREWTPDQTYDLVVSADFLEHLNLKDVKELIPRLDSLGKINYHKIACYDDGHSHLSILAADVWLNLFRDLTGKDYNIVYQVARKGREENQVVVISNR